MAKKTQGRPPIDPEAGSRIHVAFRATPRMRALLEEAAAESGRSMSQEVELRLERSFERNSLLVDALSLSFEEDAAGLILGAALVLTKTAWAAVDERSARDGKPARNWMNDPWAYDSAVIAMNAWLRYARPEGDPKQDPMYNHIMLIGNSLYNPIALVDALKGDADDPAASDAYGRRIEQLRELLGPVVERLRVDPDDKHMSFDHYPEKSPYYKGKPGR